MSRPRSDLADYFAHQARLGDRCRCARRPSRYAVATSVEGYYSAAVYLSTYRYPYLRSPAGPRDCPPTCHYCAAGPDGWRRP